MSLSGVLLPIITPFRNGEIDYESYTNLIEHYLPQGISGLIPNGTTGESPALSDYEFQSLLEKTIEIVNGRIPIYFGLGGNCTKKVLEQIATINNYPIKGILSVAPYYNRPDQRGIYEHFKAISEGTGKEIIIYNIPYRTGRNIENETICKLAQFSNVVGLKDSCGDIKQSMDLLLNKPENFSVLTGEDALYYCTLSLGGDGGILASAHIATDKFVNMHELIRLNDHKSALKIWSEISWFIPHLFCEPNPAPLKYLLTRDGLIKSDEIRLPLVGISDAMKEKLEKVGR